MLDACMQPDLITEITLQPVRRYGVDAAIFFSDIVLPLKAVGVDLDIKPGVGPVVAQPVRTLEDVAAIPDLDPGARPVHHRGGAAARRRARRHPAHRVRGRAVHGGVVPRRGRALEGARADQGDDVRRSRGLGRAHAQDRRRSPRRTSRCRSRPAPPRCSCSTRGRGRRRRRTTARHVMPYSARVLADAGDARRPADPLRRRHRRAARAHGRGRRRRGRRRLAGAARGRRTPGRRPGRPGQPRPDAWCSRRPR